MELADASICLSHCMYPDHDGCPAFCAMLSGEKGNLVPNKNKSKKYGIYLLEMGKPEYKVALICGVKRSTVRKWSRYLAEKEFGGI